MTIHPAHLKAAHYLGMKVVRVPVNADFEADVEAMRAQINANTVALAGSAGTYPHGVVDPISKLSDLAAGAQARPARRWLPGRLHPALDREAGLRGAGLRFPPARRHLHLVRHAQVRLLASRAPRPSTSATRSCAATCTSRRRTGRAASMSRPPRRAAARRGLSAAMWAAMVCMGEEGYLKAARAIMDTADKIRAGIARIPELRIMGEVHLPDQPHLGCGRPLFRQRLPGEEGLAHERLPEPARLPFLHHAAADRSPASPSGSSRTWRTA